MLKINQIKHKIKPNHHQNQDNLTEIQQQNQSHDHKIIDQNHKMQHHLDQQNHEIVSENYQNHETQNPPNPTAHK